MQLRFQSLTCEQNLREAGLQKGNTARPRFVKRLERQTVPEVPATGTELVFIHPSCQRQPATAPEQYLHQVAFQKYRHRVLAPIGRWCWHRSRWLERTTSQPTLQVPKMLQTELFGPFQCL
jgi:hypothetical protein